MLLREQQNKINSVIITTTELQRNSKRRNNNNNNNEHKKGKQKMLPKILPPANNIMLLTIIYICLATLLQNIGSSTAVSMAMPSRRPPPIKLIKECTSIDVRNECDSMLALENCTVITGYVMIALMPTRAACQYERYKFPMLREITEYVIFFDVRGLKSIRDMFPNLTVIRGTRLFLNYAFGMTHMPQFELIEFKSLVAIQRGHVYIGSNPKLCQMDKINWDRLTLSAGENHVTQVAKNCTIPECTGCDSAYCWSNFACQRFENDNVANYVHDTTHCHAQCLGGCYNETNADCVVCRGLTDYGKCVEKCPADKFLLEQHQRCYTREDCVGKRWSHFTQGNNCVKHCTSGYKPNMITRECERCDVDEPCISVCTPDYYNEVFTIYNLADADDIRGCQIVNSSLIITIRSQINERDLYNAFSSIREIRGHLKVFRSNYLTSLKFLSNLQLIHGDPLENDHYALILYDNKNLQELWPPNNLELVRGGMFMHRNNKLCNNRMRDYQVGVVHDKTLDSLQMSDQEVLCGPAKLNLLVTVISHHTAELTWLKQQTSDELEVIYRPMQPGKSHIEESELDAPICTRINWQRRLVLPHELHYNGTHYSYRIEDLEQNTRFGVLLRTFGADYRHDARSDLIFISMPPDVPTPPRIDVRNITAESLLLNLQLRNRSLEVVTHYMLIVYSLPDSQEWLDTRNFCKQPAYLLQDNEKPKNMAVEDDYDECCLQLKNVELEMQFEEDLQAELGCKLDKPWYCLQDKQAHKRAINWDNESPRAPPEQILRLNADTRTYNLTGLTHYRLYSLELQACNDAGCSSHAVYFARTHFVAAADKVPDLRVCRAENTTNYYVRFHEPLNPNSLVNAYVIHFRVKPDTKASHMSCVSRLQHEQNGYLHISRLNETYYVAAVRVVAFAGDVIGDYINITKCTPADLVLPVIMTTKKPKIPDSPSPSGQNLSVFLICFLLGIFGTILWVMYKRRCWRRLIDFSSMWPAQVTMPHGWMEMPEEMQEDRQILVGRHNVHFHNIPREEE